MASSADLGRELLAEILGRAVIEDAVETAAKWGPGAGAAESVLAVVRPRHGAVYCYERLQQSRDEATRRGYMDALRNIANGVSAQWLDSFWADPDESIQILAAKLLERLIIFREIDDETAQAALASGAKHRNPGVRQFVSYAQTAYEQHYDAQ